MDYEQSSEFQRQKEFYWKIREELLDKYSGKWVSIAQNKIAAVAESPTDALKKAYEKTKAKVMYLNKVGEEEKVMRKRIRRYNMKYEPALPVIDVLISRLDGLKEIETEGIIDTGADTSVLPEKICSQLGIHEFPIAEADIGGINGNWERKVLFGAIMRIEGSDMTAMIDCRGDVSEVIIGREVLNNFIITLNGKNLNIDIKDP
jgi:predicted aspartyl protease